MREVHGEIAFRYLQLANNILMERKEQDFVDLGGGMAMTRIDLNAEQNAIALSDVEESFFIPVPGKDDYGDRVPQPHS